MPNPLIARYAGMNVPRYTSYPTAAEFSGAVGRAEQARWLERLDPDQSLSIYLHVPYCRELCFYCACTTKMAIRDEVLARYRVLLEAEIRLVGRYLHGVPRVSRIHWGGGTPSLLEAEGLASVIEVLARSFRFEPTFEHAIELDPRAITAELAHNLARIGINRVSLGVQDLDIKVQQAIGRPQPFEVVASAVSDIRAAGIGSINFDLIYGLPQQTTLSVAETARRVIALDPDRIACYGYAHMPDMRRNQRLIDTSTLPDSLERFRQADVIAACLTEAGYAQVGIDHFARPWDGLVAASRSGRLHRNFQGYTDDESDVLLGFGASSVSRLPDGYVQNTSDINLYAETLRADNLCAMRGHRFCDEDRVRGHIIENLMCDMKVDLGTISGTIDFSDELALLRPLAAEGLVTLDAGLITMTRVGRPFVRIVAAVFDAFRHREPKRFSLAV